MIQADISEDLSSLHGIWVDAGIRGTVYISSEEIGMIGRVAITSDCPGKRKRLISSPLYHRAVSTDGKRLGAITGVLVNDLSFSVDALELSSGLADDLIYGRRCISAFSVNRNTGEVVVDPVADGKEEEI